jgi:NADPH:quinone reductase-like Zn-dependent oxidoreductase
VISYLSFYKMAIQTMKALKVVSPGKTQIRRVPVPGLRDDYLLCKVNCVSLNPTDWQVPEYRSAQSSKANDG